MWKPLWFVSASARGTIAGEPREARSDRRRLGHSFDVSCRTKAVERLRQKVHSGAAGRDKRPRTLEQEPWPDGIVGNAERERIGEKHRGRFVRRQRQRSLACGAQRLARPLHQAGIVLDTRRARELERLRVVIGEQLGVVLRPPQGFDPLAGATMLLRSCASWNLPVGDVAEQHVLERVLSVACHS